MQSQLQSCLITCAFQELTGNIFASNATMHSYDGMIDNFKLEIAGLLTFLGEPNVRLFDYMEVFYVGW